MMIKAALLSQGAPPCTGHPECPIAWPALCSGGAELYHTRCWPARTLKPRSFDWPRIVAPL